MRGGISFKTEEETRSASSDVTSLHYTEGDILDLYEIGQQISNTEHGGQGTVYRAKRKSDGLDVVLKVYAAKETGGWDAILDEEKRAGREIRFLERANQKKITGLPELIQYGATGNHIKTPVASFGLIPGRTLEDEVMDSSYNPRSERVLSLVSDLLDPLEYAHSGDGLKKVVHRDINPGNIMVNGSAVLTDWASSTVTSGKTQFKTQMYTQFFTAPEVLNAEAFDGRADIYSLGKVVEYMLLGADTFKLADGEPVDKDFENLKIPKQAREVLEKATHKNPGQRYETASQFYVALKGAFGKGGNLPVVPKPVQTNSRINSVAPWTPKSPVKSGSIKSGGGELLIKTRNDGTKEIYLIVGKEKMGLTTEKEDVYSTVKALKKEFASNWLHYPSIRAETGLSHRELENEVISQYLQHASKENPVLQEVLNDRKTLEEITEEKNPEPLFLAPGSKYSGLPREIEEYKQRREGLLNVLGAREPSLFNHGVCLGPVFFGLGGLGSIAYLAANSTYDASLIEGFASAGLVLGTGLGPMLVKYLENKKIKKQAKELDQIINEGIDYRVEKEILEPARKNRSGKINSRFDLNLRVVDPLDRGWPGPTKEYKLLILKRNAEYRNLFKKVEEEGFFSNEEINNALENKSTIVEDVSRRGKLTLYDRVHEQSVGKRSQIWEHDKKDEMSDEAKDDFNEKLEISKRSGFIKN